MAGMRFKTGGEILAGDEVKINGRWFEIELIPFALTEATPRRDMLGKLCTGGSKQWHVLYFGQRYPCRKSASYVQFQPYDRVHYTTACGGYITMRRATVIEDNGGPRVKIRWYTDDGPSSHGGRIVAYHGHPVEHWTDRERLELP